MKLRDALFSIMFVLLVASAAVFAADDEPKVLGGFPNDAAGITYLLVDPGPCGSGMRMVDAKNANGLTVAAGCYAVHGRSVVILWARGSALVVPVARVTWKESAPTTPKAALAGPTS